MKFSTEPRLLGALVVIIAGAIPMQASAVVQGAVFQNPDTTDYTQGHDIYMSPVNTGSPTSDLVSWTFTCSTCSGYGITADGSAKVVNGALGAVSDITVSGSPTGPHYVGEADSYAQYTDMLTITGGTGPGVLELQYTLDGSVSSTGTGYNLSFAYLAIFGAVGAYYQLDSGPLTSGQQVNFSGNGAKSDTVTFYVPFTYGTALNIEPILRTAADVYLDYDTTPYSVTFDYYNTATLVSAVVLDGTADNPGSMVTGVSIGSTSGLTYGADGISSTPEPATWALAGFGLAALIFLRRG